jgi:saccharopine dehydrogenase-like NADP-dependent oxidoreductase
MCVCVVVLVGGRKEGQEGEYYNVSMYKKVIMKPF